MQMVFKYKLTKWKTIVLERKEHLNHSIESEKRTQTNLLAVIHVCLFHVTNY